MFASSKINIPKLPYSLVIIFFFFVFVSTQDLPIFGADESPEYMSITENDTLKEEEYGSGDRPEEPIKLPDLLKPIVNVNREGLMLTNTIPTRIYSSSTIPTIGASNSIGRALLSNPSTAPLPTSIEEEMSDTAKTTKNLVNSSLIPLLLNQVSPAVTSTPKPLTSNTFTSMKPSTSFPVTSTTSPSSTTSAKTISVTSTTSATTLETSTSPITTTTVHVAESSTLERFNATENATTTEIPTTISIKEESTRPTLNIHMNETSSSEVGAKLLGLKGFNLIHGAILITILGVLATILVGCSIYSCQKQKLSGTLSDGTRSSTTKSSPAAKRKGSASEDSSNPGSFHNVKRSNKSPPGQLEVAQPLKQQENEEPVLDSYFA